MTPIIYLSSTFEDLKDYRKVVFEALRKSGYTVVAMEDYVATDERPVDKCLEDVANADIYVGIFAFRYGYVPPARHQNPKGLSITELEYRKAKSLKKPCLTFIVKDRTPWPPDFVDAYSANNKGQPIAKLRKHLLTEKTASAFSNPHELAALVQSAITNLEKRRRTQSSPIYKTRDHTSVTWNIKKHGSPYPGLLHFTRAYASVFFGRELEMREVLDRMRQPKNRFLLISGASGSGKSSLVDAGVLPSIENGLLSSDHAFTCVRMVPSQGSHPFDALMRPLHAAVERAGLSVLDLAKSLLKKPHTFSVQLKKIISKGLGGNGLVIFLDQMEELFTVGEQEQAHRFLSALYQATYKTDLLVIATIRSDFLSYCYSLKEMLSVINGTGHMALGPVDAMRIQEMIQQPARCAGLTISDKLVSRLVRDAGTDVSSLPLLAFALRQLFDRRKKNELTEEIFEKELGGMEGALAQHAEKVERQIAKLTKTGVKEILSTVFSPLVTISNEGQPTRHSVSKDAYDAEFMPVIDLLVKERLLQAEEGERVKSRITLAHEKLLQAWPTLAQWVSDHQNDLFTLRQADLQAAEWEQHGYDSKYLWHSDRLKTLSSLIARSSGELPKGKGKKCVHQFAAPQERLIERLKNPLTHQERLNIGLYLSELGDPRPGVGIKDGLPDIEWIKIPGGKIHLNGVDHMFTAKPFLMAKYLVTNIQFQGFLQADYDDEEWREGTDQLLVKRPTRWEANAPRETVSWFEAVAFCRWLSECTRQNIRLPTEWEWEQAATGGKSTNEFPWGEWVDPRGDDFRCNSHGNRLERTTPVGMYLNGATKQGVLDMVGNVWEWCLNTYENPEQPEAVRLDEYGEESRVLRGGSWYSSFESLYLSYRGKNEPEYHSDDIGFRLVQEIP